MEGQDRDAPRLPWERAPRSVNLICPKTTFCHPIGCPSHPQNLVCAFVPLTPWSKRTSCHLGGHWGDNSLAHLLSPPPRPEPRWGPTLWDSSLRSWDWLVCLAPAPQGVPILRH